MQNETFHDQFDAQQFKLDVERAGSNWPEGWVKGIGYMTPEQLAELEAEEALANCTPFLPYAKRRILGLLEARSIGEDSFRKYNGYAKAFAEAAPLALRLAEVLDEDERLQVATAVDPTSAQHLLDGLTVEATDICIEDVDRDLIAAWVRLMRVRGVTPKTISNHHGFLYGVFDGALEAGIIERNPCTKSKLGSNAPVRKKVILERPEFWMIYDSIDPRCRDFIQTAVGSGIRFGELTALTVEKWNSDLRVVTVDAAWKRAMQGHKVGDTKTTAGRRAVWVGEVVAELLDKACVGKEPGDLIFTAPRGGRLRQNMFGEKWLVAVARAQMDLGLTKQPRFHDLRHTFISWLRDGELADVAIKDLVGHADEKITNIYGLVTQQTKDKAARAIDEGFRRAS